VDVEIVQGSVSHTWSDYHFGDFSGWVNIFKVGTGTFTVWESTGGMPASFTRKNSFSRHTASGFECGACSF
jgi:hypothetical protein